MVRLSHSRINRVQISGWVPFYVVFSIFIRMTREQFIALAQESCGSEDFLFKMGYVPSEENVRKYIKTSLRRFGMTMLDLKGLYKKTHMSKEAFVALARRSSSVSELVLAMDHENTQKNRKKYVRIPLEEYNMTLEELKDLFLTDLTPPTGSISGSL